MYQTSSVIPIPLSFAKNCYISIFNIALKMWILTKSFAFNIFRFLRLSYSFAIIHGRYIVYNVILVLSSILHQMSRSSHPEVFCKKGIRKIFCKIYRKTPVLESLFNPKKGCGVQFDLPLWIFQKYIFWREDVKPCFFLTFNVFISHIFSENFIQIPPVVQKIWRFSLSIFTIFIDCFFIFWYFLVTEKIMTPTYNRWY